jgi:hypothetical protein
VETFLRDTDIQERHVQQRRAAILSVIPKRFELLVYRAMYDELKNLISFNQHGFMNIEEPMLNSIGEGWQVDSVYTDFSKDFDQVRHHL